MGSERLPERRSAILGLCRAREIGEDLADFSGILNRGDEAQAPAKLQRLEEDMAGVVRPRRDHKRVQRVNAVVMEGVMENRGVGDCARKRLAHATHLVSKVLQKVVQLIRGVSRAGGFRGR